MKLTLSTLALASLAAAVPMTVEVSVRGSGIHGDEAPWVSLAHAAGVDISSCKFVPRPPFCVQNAILGHMNHIHGTAGVHALVKSDIFQMVTDTCRIIPIFPPICIFQEQIVGSKGPDSGLDGPDGPWASIAHVAGIDISNCVFIPFPPVCIQNKIAAYLSGSKTGSEVATRETVRQMVAETCNVIFTPFPICILATNEEETGLITKTKGLVVNAISKIPPPCRWFGAC
ncbi:hypothetical protein EX30DRAFT_348497 [Ascodesmis nigricans]|uniref:Uncharacterized protein n=1 Tax=Ascodesmis nigricans TaxID=341454 RepID=A0A4S2MYP4_9PEZI|nr:hypothetical protein EX30DRAFT_348497 [Ascodesmis nigricans]